jgi:hypothetical protein
MPAIGREVTPVADPQDDYPDDYSPPEYAKPPNP